MLVVSIMTVTPKGGEKLHTLEIEDRLRGTTMFTNFDVRLKTLGEPTVEARLKGHRRRDGALSLVKHAIEALTLQGECI